jgi:hypothetical protein
LISFNIHSSRLIHSKFLGIQWTSPRSCDWPAQIHYICRHLFLRDQSILGVPSGGTRLYVVLTLSLQVVPVIFTAPPHLGNNHCLLEILSRCSDAINNAARRSPCSSHEFQGLFRLLIPVHINVFFESHTFSLPPCLHSTLFLLSPFHPLHALEGTATLLSDSVTDEQTQVGERAWQPQETGECFLSSVVRSYTQRWKSCAGSCRESVSRWMPRRYAIHSTAR